MARPSDYPGFKQLLAEWNRKLAESGFKDIENTGSNGEALPILPTGTMRRYSQLTEIERDAKSIYFREISDRIIETVFKSDLEFQILTLYSEGISQAEIKRKLKIRGHRCKIYYPIYKWLKKWGLK